MIKLLLILAYFACDHAALADRIEGLGPSASLAAFAALYGLFAALLVATAFIRNHPLRIALAAALAGASVFQHSFEWTAAAPLTYESFLNMMAAQGQVAEALAQHGAVLLRAVPVGLLLLVGIALPPRTRIVPAWAALAAPLASFAVMTGLLYLRGGEGTRALPAALPPLSFAALKSFEDLRNPPGPRQKVSIPRSAPLAQGDIVLLVDESIAGNYLDINNAQGVRSGLARPPRAIRATNFGYAASVHFCSANSNLVLRHGGTRETYQEAIARRPSIWAYAKTAGMRTVFIDAQMGKLQLQNMMTRAERREIDQFVQFDGTPVVERDMAAGRMLARLLHNGRREFIYVNKIGAHFPVADKFPDSMARYRPVMKHSSGMGFTWSSDRTGFTGTPREWVEYRNSYRNTLLWNVGTFFDRLLASGDLGGATIIYTSDHGQDLHERGNPGNNTHCGTVKAAQEVGVVPMVVLEDAATQTLDWEAQARARQDGMSHFRIFPSLLALMGYDRKGVKPFYGPALDESDPDEFTYNLVFQTHLGRKPEWQKIDLGEIVSPPVSDYLPTRRIAGTTPDRP
jgi:lipid A ethanolaminephosphotransferase